MLPARPDHDAEREEINRRLTAFDDALEELRKAKQRLTLAADLYLDRLQGVRHGGIR